MKFILFLMPLTAGAQWLTIGVTGGVPISPHTETLANNNGPNDLYQKPWAAGPTVEFSLPWHFSLDTAMLCERFHRDASEGITPGRGTGSVNFGYRQSLAANAWLFPLLVRCNLGHRVFIEAGPTLRHLDVFSGQGIQYDFDLQPHPASFTFDPAKPLDVAITAGAGIRFHEWLVDIAPEIRYLHWTAAYEQPARDQAMLMLSVSFPARK